MRGAAELTALDGLVIPGGESTSMLKLLAAEGLLEPLRQFGERKPIFGTCAGAVLLARDVTNPVQSSLGLVDIAIERNAYGRQLSSRVVPVTLAAGLGNGDGSAEMEAVFIRAPIIRRIGEGVRALATGNPGCLMQIGAGALTRRLPLDVIHPVELLAALLEAGESG